MATIMQIRYLPCGKATQAKFPYYMLTSLLNKAKP